MPPVELNYLAILVAAIVNMILGAIWYAPPLFGNTWMALTGISKEDAKKTAGKAYVGTFIAVLILAYVLAHIVDYAEATTIAEGAQTGFWIWLGFVATTTFMDVMFAKKPLRLYVINNGLNILNFVVMGAILAVWT